MTFNKRKKSRETALQIIYSWNILKSKNIKTKIKELKLLKLNIFKNIDLIYLNKLIYGVIKNIQYLNKIINLNINKNTKYIGNIEKIILNISIFELKKNKSIPYKVIINEGIELSKKFGSQNSYKLINSILDKIHKKK